jgi:hypothetical protein
MEANIGNNTESEERDEELAPSTPESEIDSARREQLARMAANMIIDEPPKGSYSFVRKPGL